MGEGLERERLHPVIPHPTSTYLDASLSTPPKDLFNDFKSPKLFEVTNTRDPFPYIRLKPTHVT